MVSYEVAMGLIMISVLLTVGSLNLTEIVHAQKNSMWFFIPHLPMAVVSLFQHLLKPTVIRLTCRKRRRSWFRVITLNIQL